MAWRLRILHHLAVTVAIPFLVRRFVPAEAAEAIKVPVMMGKMVALAVEVPRITLEALGW